MTKSVHFVVVPGPQAAWEGVPYVRFAETLLSQQVWPQESICYRVTHDPKDADIILILEPNYFKTRAYLQQLAAMEELQRFPQKCFAINQDDNPVPLLPGVYVAMPAFRRENEMVIPYCYLVPTPNKVFAAASEAVSSGGTVWTLPGWPKVASCSRNAGISEQMTGFSPYLALSPLTRHGTASARCA